MRTIKLAMLGYGNAGKAFKSLLEEKAGALAEAYDSCFEFVSIVTKSKGDFLGSSKDTALDVAAKADYDILIELTPLNIITGQPAISHIEAALNRGKDVITANKGPIAHDYKRLSNLAKQNGCSFFFETTVMDGTPVFNLVHDTLKFCTVTEVSGILNSTTNFILEEMEKGLPMNQIMEKGRELGFVEADPLMDIEGYDSAGKITALLNVLMDANMTPAQIDRKGIEGVTYKDIEAASEKGCKVKLVCKGWREHGKVYGRVAPELVPLTHLYATINGTSSILSITTDLMGKLTIIEEEPEILQTAYGVFSDLVRIVEQNVGF
jgi:homoserine dehydrogenase